MFGVSGYLHLPAITCTNLLWMLTVNESLTKELFVVINSSSTQIYRVGLSKFLCFTEVLRPHRTTQSPRSCGKENIIFILLTNLLAFITLIDQRVSLHSLLTFVPNSYKHGRLVDVHLEDVWTCRSEFRTSLYARLRFRVSPTFFFQWVTPSANASSLLRNGDSPQGMSPEAHTMSPLPIDKSSSWWTLSKFVISRNSQSQISDIKKLCVPSGRWNSGWWSIATILELFIISDGTNFLKENLLMVTVDFN